MAVATAAREILKQVAREARRRHDSLYEDSGRERGGRAARAQTQQKAHTGEGPYAPNALITMICSNGLLTML